MYIDNWREVNPVNVQLRVIDDPQVIPVKPLYLVDEVALQFIT